MHVVEGGRMKKLSERLTATTHQQDGRTFFAFLAIVGHHHSSVAHHNVVASFLATVAHHHGAAESAESLGQAGAHQSHKNDQQVKQLHVDDETMKVLRNRKKRRQAEKLTND